MGKPNPFYHRGPIRDRAYFFGRDYETGQVLSLLGNEQSISLVGQRRIGKTSLLFHVADPEIFTQHGLNPDEHLFVYVDCGALAGLDQPGLYRVFLEELADALTEVGQSPDWLKVLDDTRPMSYRVFERALRDLTRGGCKPILLLDEFDLMSRNPHLDPDFFSGLRALTAKYPIAFFTASRYPLLELTYADASTLSSPFFNIFNTIRLGLFSEDTSRSLLAGLAAIEGVTFTPPTLDVILDLAGPHPLFLQIAGFYACELQQAKGSPLNDEDYPELGRRFLASVEEHYAYYWRSLTDAEQRILAALPASQQSDEEIAIARQLRQECLVLRQGERYDYLSSTFRTFVASQPITGLLQAGPIAIDESQRQVLLHGQFLSLTSTQYALLVFLVGRGGQVITVEELEKAVWGDEYIEDPERLKSVIKGLRRALGDEAARLENVRGVGYVWRG